MKFFITLFLTFCACNLSAQKQLIDSIAIRQWYSLDASVKLSDNGNYLQYKIDNLPVGKQTTILKSADGKWERKYIGYLKSSTFTADSKSLFYLKGKDSLAMVTLGTDITTYISGVSYFSLQTINNEEWLCYLPSDKSKTLILKSIRTSEEKSFENVEHWNFSEDGSVLLLEKSVSNKLNEHTLVWVNIHGGKTYNVWEGSNIDNVTIDSRYKQLVFRTSDKIWYYKEGALEAISLQISELPGYNALFELDRIANFSKDGKQIFVYLQERVRPQSPAGSVAIWSYLDRKLPSEPDFLSKSLLAVLDLNKRRFIQLQEKSTDFISFPISKKAPDSLVLVKSNEHSLEPWSVYNILKYRLTSINSGRKTYLSFLDSNGSVIRSPSGKYLIFFNSKDNCYFSYEIKTGLIRNLTKGLNVSWTELYRNDMPLTGPRGLDKLMWSKNDASLFVYDTYDIWKLDPINRRIPVNLTNQYGKRNKIIFDFISPSQAGNILVDENVIYLSGFNSENKNNGFYLQYGSKAINPKVLTEGPYIFNCNNSYDVYGTDFQPLKAKNSNVYVVRRMSAHESPNFFSTKDFRTFTRLSDLAPEKKFNWYSTELHTWKSLDGRFLKGILYKPDDFDPNKKYPVIFNYYERKSDALNAYINPEILCKGCQIDIPTYVSNGYLIFTPDIYYEIGDPMQGTFDAVVSATNYISTLPFVNSKKLGIQGCSWGGIQTSYLVTRTNLFAAACSTIGWANWISTYGAINIYGESLSNMFENGQPRIGKSLWDKKDVYFKNSAILSADKVTTPFLMMNNKNDGAIPYADALQFFTGLRRMGKKVWLLSYPEGTHGVFGKDADDLSIRMMQFFDHYLKDHPAPMWMTRGAESEKMVFKSAYDYDTAITTPGPGLLKPKEKSIIDSLMIRKPSSFILK